MSKDYELVYDGLYRWKREGKVAEALTGGFMRKVDAKRALEVYLLTKEPEVSTISDTDALEDLTTKSDLLKYAEKRNIEVPTKYKQPSAIKKWLTGKGGV